MLVEVDVSLYEADYFLRSYKSPSGSLKDVPASSTQRLLQLSIGWVLKSNDHMNYVCPPKVIPNATFLGFPHDEILEHQ